MEEVYSKLRGKCEQRNKGREAVKHRVCPQSCVAFRLIKKQGCDRKTWEETVEDALNPS